MIDKPKVSIIVPFYNAAKSLGYCLDSISAQRGTSFEAILIDDGSVDDSHQIAMAHTSDDSRFKIIREANSGVSVARNTGLDLAQGDYLVFVDADDVLMPNALAVMCDKMDESTDLLICSSYLIRRFRNRVLYKKPNLVHCESLTLCSRTTLDHIDSLLSTLWAKMYRASVIKDNELRFDEGVPLGEDTRFNLSYCSKINSIIQTSDDLVYGYALGGAASSRTFYRNILKINHELADTYESASWLFSEEYLSDLKRRLLNSGLLHIYAHCNRQEARTIASKDLESYFGTVLSNGSQEFADSNHDVRSKEWLRCWEEENRLAISSSKLKQKLRRVYSKVAER